jgi:thiosulfate/3-mercaptopyruvate sulfurtransferase
MFDLTLDPIINGESLCHLIDTQNPNLLVVDTRPFSSYNKGHIPSAINIDLMNFHWFDTSREGILQFNRQMMVMLNYMGIKAQRIVVFYDDISGSSASRGIWLLNYFSHEHAYILDGGFKNWIKSNYPIETATNPYIPSESTFNINTGVISDAEYIKNKIEKNGNDVIIIDCRSKMEYDGLVVRAARRGHIPSAINIDWINNLENEKFKDFERLIQLYSFIPKDKEVITYCQGGYRAANTYLVLKKLGYSNVKMYLGSWGEWGNVSSLPIECS